MRNDGSMNEEALKNTPAPKASDMEVANLQQGLNLLRSQLQSGHINKDYMLKQLDKLDSFVRKVSEERQHRSDSARFEALYNVSRILGTSLDIQTVLDQVMDAIIALTKAERGFLMLRGENGELDVRTARNLDQQTLDSTDFKFSRTVTNHVLDTEDPIVTTNASTDPRFAGQASIVAQALRGVMATPLRARGKVIGVVYVDSRALTRLFNEKDLEALDAFSAQAAIALDNAILFSATDEELARRVDELLQLRRIDLLLNETLDAQKAMAYTLEWACRLGDATSGHLGLIQPKAKHIEAIHHYGLSEDDEKPEHLDEVYPQVQEVVRSGQSAQSVVKGKSVLVVPIRREQAILGVLLLNHDSEDGFSTEAQSLVEQVVTRAAVAIENGRLYEAVRAADKAKSEFVGIVAHDLKSPMTGIKGYSEVMLMQKEKLDARHIEFLNRIKDTVGRMEMLVSDLADISRLESGHFFMDEMRVSVASVIQAVKDSTLPQILEREHEFIVEAEDNLPDLWVDYYRLMQVLVNLVSNAYKYTPNGGKITISAKKRNDTRIQFSVTDTGIGLSKEAVEKLGTKFWRSDDEYTRSQPGTGLGFSITRSLVEQMGSDIEIESEIGKGSTFIFDIAVAKEQKHAPVSLPTSG